MIKREIVDYLEKVWGMSVYIESPVEAQNGDYSTNVALTGWKEAGRNSAKEYAEKLVEKLNGSDERDSYFSKVEVAGPGFINFYLSSELLGRELGQKFERYFQMPTKKLHEMRIDEGMSGKKVMVEYAHPNTHKEMHIGHMRTLIVGESLARVKYAAGAEVFRANYQGDIGPHVAKAVWGVERLMKKKGISWKSVESFDLNKKAKLLGQGYALGNEHYEEKREEIDGINRDLYSGSGKYWEVYERTREWSLEYFEAIYHRFHTYFDRLYFESEVWERGKKIVQENTPKVFTESEGAIVYEGEKQKLHTRVFVTSDGNPTYEGKDIGLAFVQFEEFAFDVNIHVVANEQTGYFKVVFAALSEIDPELGEKELHIPMGMVGLKGAKMSSRTGEVYTINDLLEKVYGASMKQIDNPDLTEHAKGHVAESVSIGAVKYSILRTGVEQDVSFDVDQSVSLEGDSGPYIQYTYARTQSVLRTYQSENEEVGIERGEFSFDLGGLVDVESRLVRELVKFEDVVVAASKNNAPNLLCTYLHGLAQTYNSFYGSEKILGSEREKFRLTLNYVVGEILRHGLYLLGIDAPERM